MAFRLDDNGELMKFKNRRYALAYLMQQGYTEQDIADTGIKLIYTNERRECNCCECESINCYIMNKFQRLPPETTRGLGLGLCPKLPEQ